MSPFQETIQHNIDTAGQHLFGIFPTVKDPGTPFIYTIGNSLLGLPELLIIGNFTPNILGHALNELGKAMRSAGEPFDEGMVDIDWSFPFKLRKTGPLAKSEYTIQAGQYLGHEDYTVMQVMICDPSGLYPGDEGVLPEYNVPQP